jgi:ClpP class serine protease
VPRQERLEIIGRIQSLRKTNLICYLTSDRPNASAQIQKDAIQLFYEHLQHLREFPKMDRLDVFIFTGGGDALAAFGLGRLLREFVPWFGVLVPAKCHSAGTLFAIGANQVAMTRWAAPRILVHLL